MLVNPRELFDDAEKNHYALAGINVPSLDALMAVIEAAEELKRPVMLGHAEVHNPYMSIQKLGPVMRYMAERASVPVVLFVDHGETMPFMMEAIRNGFGCIMYDCSELPFEENVRRLKTFTDIAHAANVVVEGEVGRMPSAMKGVGGCEKSGQAIEDIRQYFTDPAEAASFVEQTGVDLLTISFGTVHGMTVEDPVLDIDLLKKIHEQVPAKLVVHGMSGVEESQIRNAVRNGIRKINYYSGVATLPGKILPGKIQEKTDEGELAYIHEVSAWSREVMKERAKQMIQIFADM